MNEFKIEGNRVWSLRFRNTKIREIMDLGVCLKRERERGRESECLWKEENRVKKMPFFNLDKFVIIYA